METFESEIKKLENKEKKTKQAILLLESQGYTIIPPKIYDTTDTSEFYCMRYLQYNMESYGTKYRISFFPFLKSDFLNKIKASKECVFAGFSVDMPRMIKEEIEQNVKMDIRALLGYGAYCVIIYHE